jgi:glycosyltransferase involved in cell wall biosynthesis
MRILWHSSSPETRTGYGIITREAVKRLVQDGHFVRVGTKHEYVKYTVRPDGLEIFEGTDVFLVNQMISREKFDCVVTLWDVWILQGKRMFPKAKWVAYVPVNTAELCDAYKEVLSNTVVQIAQTRHGADVMRRAGFAPLYVPHGIDASAYFPDGDARRRFQTDIGWTDENFVVGCVGINYGDDTKGIIPLMLAFRRLHERHPESRLLLCTLANEREAVASCINYAAVAKALGLDGLVGWPDQLDYYLTRMADADMRRMYCGMDVFCLPSRGESFGLPAVEAQACGVPAILSNATSGPELVGPGWLIDVDMWDDAVWTPAGIWRYYPRPSSILAKLEAAWSEWKNMPEFWAEKKTASRENALRYDWEKVWPEYWRPAIAAIEEAVRGK